MSEQNCWVVAVFSAYMVFMLVIGGVASRWTRTMAAFAKSQKNSEGSFMVNLE